MLKVMLVFALEIGQQFEEYLKVYFLNTNWSGK